MNRTLAQRRAAYAIARIKEHQQQGNYGNYLSYVEALPAAIHANGLGQAIAMELAAKDEGHKYLASDVSGWLCGSDEAAPYRDFSPTMDPHALLSAIVENNESRYLWAQSEALALLVWLKKIARAMLGPEKETSK
jgi:CRISPR-associated protein Cmr5